MGEVTACQQPQKRGSKAVLLLLLIKNQTCSFLELEPWRELECPFQIRCNHISFYLLLLLFSHLISYTAPKRSVQSTCVAVLGSLWNIHRSQFLLGPLWHAWFFFMFSMFFMWKSTEFLWNSYFPKGLLTKKIQRKRKNPTFQKEYNHNFCG